jgi:hypothetical protein
MSPAVTVDGAGSSLLLLLPDAHAATSARVIAAGRPARDDEYDEKRDRMGVGGQAAGEGESTCRASCPAPLLL